MLAITIRSNATVWKSAECRKRCVRTVLMRSMRRGRGICQANLFEKCAVGPAITTGDLAGLTSEEFGELWDVVSGEAAAWADRLLKIHSWEN
jgi:hypothetical protein